MSKTNAIADKATDVLLNMVNVTIQTMSDVVEFGKQQIPEVIHQLLVWKAVSAGLWQLFSICFMFITFIAVLLMENFRKLAGYLVGITSHLQSF